MSGSGTTRKIMMAVMLVCMPCVAVTCDPGTVLRSALASQITQSISTLFSEAIGQLVGNLLNV